MDQDERTSKKYYSFERVWYFNDQRYELILIKSRLSNKIVKNREIIDFLKYNLNKLINHHQ